ncbi:DegV family protein [Peribacillus sp. SCS-155]|uniref:DegV family protein n=1 Tax=Peribacillus sedimenti TaxID=3115297 RepID=UPI00390660EC
MTKPRIAWITDTTSSLGDEFIQKHNIHVVPLQVIINQQSYKETIDITDQEFYERMEKEEGTFQSSQASIGDFADLYKQLKNEYDLGIAIHASSVLTGTFQASKMAAEMEDFKLFAIDSQTGSYPLSFMIKKGVELAEQGMEAEGIVTVLESYIAQTRLYLIPSNLDQLHKSGRVSGSQKLIASLFNIKPILSIEEGAARIKEKVRSEKKAIASVISILKEDIERRKVDTVAIIHANRPDAAAKIEQHLKEIIPSIKTEIIMLIPVAGVHTGAGTLGLSWVIE